MSSFAVSYTSSVNACLDMGKLVTGELQITTCLQGHSLYSRKKTMVKFRETPIGLADSPRVGLLVWRRNRDILQEATV